MLLSLWSLLAATLGGVLLSPTDEPIWQMPPHTTVRPESWSLWAQLPDHWVSSTTLMFAADASSALPTEASWFHMGSFL